MRKIVGRLGVFAGVGLWVSLSALGQPQTETKPAEQGATQQPPIEAKPIIARVSPSDYQGQGKAGTVTIAADFDGHSIPTPDAIYSSEDYVALEVALYGPTGARLNVSLSDFTLQINSKKNPLEAQAFGYLTHSLKDPEWQPPEEDKEKKSKTGINTGGGGGDQGTPAPPKMPLELRRAMEQRVLKSVLPTGDRELPVAGLIFFLYRGKPQSIKSMELNYEGPAGTASIALHP